VSGFIAAAAAAILIATVFAAVYHAEVVAHRTGEPFGKAGAYALQGAGSVLVRSVDGSVSNVIGLPLASVVDLARSLGLELLE